MKDRYMRHDQEHRLCDDHPCKKERKHMPNTAPAVIDEETVYQTYLSILRKQQEIRLREKLLRQKFRQTPKKEKMRAFLNSEEYLEQVQQYFAQSEDTRYLTLPFEQQSPKIREEYLALKEFIRKDLEKGKTIKGIDHFYHLLEKERRLCRMKDIGTIIEKTWQEKKADCLKEIYRRADHGFRYGKLYYWRETNGWPRQPLAKERLDPDNFQEFPEQTNILFNIACFLSVRGEFTYIDTVFSDHLTSWMIRAAGIGSTDREYRQAMFDAVLDSDIPRELIDLLLKRYDNDTVRHLVSKNKAYRKAKRDFEERETREATLRATILETIPERYADMFPLARSIRRKFIIHTGPTNSGKTHDAVHRMVTTKRGVYLGPLRLMAYEQYENIRSLAGKCTLLTGEEEIREEGAAFTASTIEMLDTSRHYDCAVVDEAQMIGDRSRGGAWSKAMYGLYADEIQVCTAPEALDLLIRIITDCADEYRVVRHERFTPLVAEEKTFGSDLKSAEKGDALIVFSRRDVHAVAAELQRMNHTVSIIYGALPYDVRHREAKKFADGETDILVATDAIGMGMNLPIRRIVFLQMHKFDGYEKRSLSTSEILQIAGRAGRKGLYSTGYVAVSENRGRFMSKFTARPKKVEKAYVAFPDILLTLDCSLSETLERWKNMEVLDDLLKGDTDEQIFLAKTAERFLTDKELIYRLVFIPFDTHISELTETWTDCVRKEAEGKHCDLSGYLEHGRFTAENGDIAQLELEYKRMDLLYGYSRIITKDEQSMKEISRIRKDLSSRIMDILSEQKLAPKRCRHCGKELPWNYPYPICQKCFNLSHYD